MREVQPPRHSVKDQSSSSLPSQKETSSSETSLARKTTAGETTTTTTAAAPPTQLIERIRSTSVPKASSRELQRVGDGSANTAQPPGASISSGPSKEISVGRAEPTSAHPLPPQGLPRTAGAAVVRPPRESLLARTSAPLTNVPPLSSRGDPSPDLPPYPLRGGRDAQRPSNRDYAAFERRGLDDRLDPFPEPSLLQRLSPHGSPVTDERRYDDERFALDYDHEYHRRPPYPYASEDERHDPYRRPREVERDPRADWPAAPLDGRDRSRGYEYPSYPPPAPYSHPYDDERYRTRVHEREGMYPTRVRYSPPGAPHTAYPTSQDYAQAPYAHTRTLAEQRLRDYYPEVYDRRGPPPAASYYDERDRREEEYYANLPPHSAPPIPSRALQSFERDFRPAHHRGEDAYRW